jgi:hypothetical protein
MSSMQEMVYAKRPAWLTFVAVVLFSVAFLRVLSAIYYFADSWRVSGLALKQFGPFSNHLFLYGLWDLGIAALAFFAAYSVLQGQEFGRIVGYAWAILTIVQSFFIIEWTPWFAAAMLVLAGLVIYGLASTSEWQEAEVTPTVPVSPSQPGA